MKKLYSSLFILFCFFSVYSFDLDFNYSTDFEKNNFFISFSDRNNLFSHFSYTPFINFNIDSIISNSDKLKNNLDYTNQWADSFVNKTVPLNILLLGTPYIFMGIVDIFEYPYIATYGITFDLSFFEKKFFNLLMSIGIENNCYASYRKLDRIDFFRPFGIYSLQVNGSFKYFNFYIKPSYNFDILSKLKDSADCSYWSISVGSGLSLFNKTTNNSRSSEYDDKYYADLDIY